MKKILVTLCVSAALTTVAYADDAQSTTAAPTTTNATTQTDNAQVTADSLIWVMAVDKTEIDASKLAMKKATNPAVKSYANMMVKQHSQNLAQTKALLKKLKIKSTDTTASTAVMDDGKKLAADLKDQKGKDFDKAYVNAMVTGHADALDKINSFIGDEKNPQIEAFLKNTREAVQHHLDEGKKIQSTLS